MDSGPHRPEPDQAEVSLFGTGYGESVLLHLGLNQWAVVDSCVDHNNGLPVIDYLDAMGIDPSSAVKLVVASHWHDDHVRGLARLLEVCEQACFSCSSVFRYREAMAAARFRDEPGPERRSRPLRELSRTLDIVCSRLERPGGSTFFVWGEAGSRPIFERRTPFVARIDALTPSASSRLEAVQLLGQQLRVGTDRTRRERPHPNHASVVLWVTVGRATMLLGADLENRREHGMGWNGILNDIRRPAGRADVYKVAHHGSANADEPRIWAELLVDRPPALLAPWQYPRDSVNYLPQPDDVDRLCALAGELWVAASVGRRSQNECSSYGFGVVPDNVQEIVEECGRISFRCNAMQPDAWIRDYAAPAYRACP